MALRGQLGFLLSIFHAIKNNIPFMLMLAGYSAGNSILDHAFFCGVFMHITLINC